MALVASNKGYGDKKGSIPSMKGPNAGLVFAILLATPASALAHGMSVYVSTPISPPDGFQWVAFSSIAFLVAVNFLLLGKLKLAAWSSALLRSPVGIGAFAVCFFLFGVMATSLSTAPPPGLDWGQPVLWGRDWTAVGSLFIRWNIYGLVFLWGGVTVVTKLWKDWRSRKTLVLMLTNLGAYVICLLPYILTGAFTHGRPGGYTHDTCQMQISRLGAGLLGYARANENRMPDEISMEGVVREIGPFLTPHEQMLRRPFHACPVSGAFEKKATPYTWNIDLSGKGLVEFEELQEPAPLISCSYHGPSQRVYFALFTEDILLASTQSNDQPVDLRYCRQVPREK